MFANFSAVSAAFDRFDFESPTAAGIATAIIITTGYLGAEVASENYIERLLWPQRSYNGLSPANILKLSLFHPAGGSLYRAVVQAIDVFFKHSLQKGIGCGHLLGTAFFPDTDMKYKVHSCGGQKCEEEFVRNGLLVRALAAIPPLKHKKISAPSRPLRQQIAVSHLTLFNFDNIPPRGVIPLDAMHVTAKTILGIIASELIAIFLALAVATVWGSAYMMLWLAPLTLKLLAAVTTLEREDLNAPTDLQKKSAVPDSSVLTSKFEVHLPGTGFQVIEGPEQLVLQFFRHYGHPIRCRWREVVQMLLVAAFGLASPISLMLVLIYAPVPIKLMWSAYQMYLVLAMLVARYAGGDTWATTEERIAEAFASAEEHQKDCVIMLRNGSGEMIGARLSRTSHSSYSEGKAKIQEIILS